MRAHLHFRPATFLEVFDQLFTRFELGARRLVAIEIADETNPEPDVVHVIAVDVAAAHLADPAIADLDLAVPRRGSVSDDEMVGQAIPHPPNLAVIIIESSCVALPRAAVVDDDVAPAAPGNRCAINRPANGSRQISITAAAPEEARPDALRL